jgi:hypothetical protein
VKKKIASALAIDVKKDIKDPQKFPWPLKDASVTEMTCAGVFEYLPAKLRGKFMDEVYRVLVPQGRAAFITRFWNSGDAYQDYLYEWPPISEKSYLYFNKGWREANNCNDRGLKCNFGFSYGHSVEAETASRGEDARKFYIKHYADVVQALQVFLVKE